MREPVTADPDGPVHRAKAPAKGHDRPLSTAGIPGARGILYLTGQFTWCPLTLECAPGFIRMSKCQGPTGSDGTVSGQHFMEGRGRPPRRVDSHFHLDRSRNVLHRPDASVDEICSAIRPDAEFKYKLIGGVVIFCDPPSYPTREEVGQLQDDSFLVGIGLHPKQSEQYSEADFASFQRCLEYPEVKVLGEIGLDYSVNRSSWAAQHLVLDRVLKHLQPTQVLVLTPTLIKIA